MLKTKICQHNKNWIQKDKQINLSDNKCYKVYF